VKRFELPGQRPEPFNDAPVEAALELAGVEFLDPTEDGKGEGARLRRS
jgi:hypothetical protein